MTKSPDRVGQVIAQRYELLAVIGRGGQGTVYRATDRWSERQVAIKVVGAAAANDPRVIERLVREQQAMSALKGTAAVELFDVCRGKSSELCLVMELLRGVDLDEHLYALEERGERVALERMVEIFDPIVSTLDVAHAAGILHRDLKPANLFLVEGGGVRLLDFGMARLKKSAPLTAAGTVMGSPSFMAPEAWKGISDLMDQRADVYSLGVMLFRVLGGELPFTGSNLQQKFMNATTAARPSLRRLRPDLPRDVDGWVEAALALSREERFGNVRALWSALLAVLQLESKDTSKRPSFWAAAKEAVRMLARASEAPPKVEAARGNELSLVADALSRSTFRVSATPGSLPRDDGAEPAATSDATIELGSAELARVSAPQTAPASERAVERTISMSDDDFLPTNSPDAPVQPPRAPPRRPKG